MESKLIKYAMVKPGDKIDILAMRIYGDPNKFTLLLEDNPNLDIFNLKPGQRLKVKNA